MTSCEELGRPRAAVVNSLALCCAAAVTVLSGCSDGQSSWLASRFVSENQSAAVRENLYATVSAQFGDLVFVRPIGGRCCRSIKQNVSAPWATAADQNGDVFVSNWGAGSQTKPSITEYSADGQLVRSIDTAGYQVARIAVDSHGTLYVLRNARIDEYAAGQTRPQRFVPGWDALAIGPHNELFTNGHKGVYEYAVGQTAPKRLIAGAGGGKMLVDGHGVLYTQTYGFSSVQEYGPKSTGTILRSVDITSGFITDIALSPNGNLYVAVKSPSGYASEVRVYESGKTHPQRVITAPEGLNFGRALAPHLEDFMAVDYDEALFALMSSGDVMKFPVEGTPMRQRFACCAATVGVYPKN